MWQPCAEEVPPHPPEDQLPHEARALRPLRERRPFPADAGRETISSWAIYILDFEHYEAILLHYVQGQRNEWSKITMH